MAAFNFELDRAIYRFYDVEPFTIGSACKGIQAFGGIGPGKTSGGGEALACAFFGSGIRWPCIDTVALLKKLYSNEGKDHITDGKATTFWLKSYKTWTRAI